MGNDLAGTKQVLQEKGGAQRVGGEPRCLLGPGGMVQMHDLSVTEARSRETPDRMERRKKRRGPKTAAARKGRKKPPRYQVPFTPTDICTPNSSS